MNIIKRAEAIVWIKEHPRVEFSIKFKKADGTIRLMNCKFGYDDGTLVKNPLTIGKPKPAGIVRVYDIDKKEYRSFKEDSLMSINMDGKEWVDIEESRIVSHTQVK